MAKAGEHLKQKKINKKLLIIISAVAVLVLAAIILIFVLSGGRGTPPAADEGLTEDNVVDTPQPEPAPQPEPVPELQTDPEPTTEPEPVVDEEPEFINPLTGEETETDISGKRPYAVMVNNIKKALPQYGIADADIIYEAPVEGGITRMIAIYQDISEVELIGSVRSSRPYYIDILMGYDAIYVHAGGSNEAYNIIDKRDIDNIDGVHGPRVDDVFYRDPWRRKNLGFEHSLMAVSEEVIKYAADRGMRLEHNEDYVYKTKFTDDVNLRGESAQFIDVYMTSYKNTQFEYNAETDMYLLSQYGSEYTDNNSGEQVAVKNVIAIFAETKSIDAKDRQKITLVDIGEGYYACGGKYVPITWMKDSLNDNFVFTYKDGTPITFERGNTYVCICSEKQGEVVFG